MKILPLMNDFEELKKCMVGCHGESVENFKNNEAINLVRLCTQ